MKEGQKIYFSGPVSVFHDKWLPETATLAGYSALIDALNLELPLPHTLCAIGLRHKIYEQDGWKLYTPRHAPSQTIEGHLTFALKYEGIDLLVLKRIFHAVDKSNLERMVQEKPNSAYARRVWFLYEWLLEEPLDLPDAKSGNYAEVVDTKLQWAITGTTSQRHRVRNNLPGTRQFCPLAYKTEKLAKFVETDLRQEAEAVIGKISKSVLSRTAAFLLLKDSKSSYAIEGESPPHNRIQRWGKAIGEAGKHPLNLKEFLRLQRIVIGNDDRFIEMGLRKEGGFVGEHEQSTRMPLPDHISAKHGDLERLMMGLIDFDHTYSAELEPVIAAAILAFGFVYIHPFEDGNGRLHRYLIHHTLSARGFNPPGMVFPVSAAILDRIDDYRRVLESHSARVLSFIEWQPTPKMNVDVTNETEDFYCYFDATPHAEFLFECVERTVREDLPDEADFLQKYDAFKNRIEQIAEMPASKVDLLFNFLHQNQGLLSKRAKEREFEAFTEDEAQTVEQFYSEIFKQAD